MSELQVRETSIGGLYEVSLVVNRDNRGSFREAYQAEKLRALGLPDLGPVQWNVAEIEDRGTLRGFHAEPWDKYVHMIVGEAFCAIVDLRPESPTFKRVEQFTMTTANAIYITAGLGNSYQVTSDGGVYGYLVNQHWSPAATYTMVSYADPELAVPWPIDPADSIISDKDQNHPPISAVFPS